MLLDIVNLDQEAVIRSAFEMPALPQSTVRLSSLIANDDVELVDVVQVIECDPALTLKLLRIANSVYSSSSRQIGTVKDAVIRLGTGAVLGLAIGSCVQPTIVKVIPGYNISGTQFWRHSLAAAMSTECLRAFTKAPISPLAFTAALLHDIGKVLLGNYLDESVLNYLEQAREFGKRSAVSAETEILSLHHGEVGSLVAQHWGLPETVSQGIGFHHSPQDCDELIAYVTHFANYVAHQVAPQAAGADGEWFEAERIDISDDLSHLGLSEVQTIKIFQAVKERLAILDSSFR